MTSRRQLPLWRLRDPIDRALGEEYLHAVPRCRVRGSPVDPHDGPAAPLSAQQMTVPS